MNPGTTEPVAATAQSHGIAIVLMLTASAFIALSTLVAKMLGTGTLGPEIHPLQVTFGRFCFAFVFLLGLSALMRPRLMRPNLRLHVARSTFGWAGVTLMFAAAARIPLADATAISFLNPVFAMALAVIFLKEQVGWVRWSAAAIAFFGALVLLRPGTGSFQPAALLALASAAVIGCEVILIKMLSDKETPFTILLTNNAIGLTIATAAASFVWVSPSPAVWMGMAAVGLSMATAQICFVNSLARAETSFIVPFSYAALIFAAVYDAVVFSALPDSVSVLGAAVIITGGGLLAWREGMRR
ncbi:MAG: DMT family transporter [Pseudomonadota bacterium]